jgi:hypothetical protein
VFNLISWPPGTYDSWATLLKAGGLCVLETYGSQRSLITLKGENTATWKRWVFLTYTVQKKGRPEQRHPKEEHTCDSETVVREPLFGGTTEYLWNTIQRACETIFGALWCLPLPFSYTL